MENKKKLLGSNIKAERNRKNYSQAVLAEKIDLSVNSLSAIERGGSVPGAFTLYNISKALDVDINEFFKGID